MKIAGDHAFDLPRQMVWEALLDPEVLKRTLPGCEDLEETGEHEFAGKLKMKVGPVQGVFEGKVTLSDLEPPTGYRLVLNGKGAPGFVNGEGTIALEETEAGGTLLRYDVDAQVGGRIAAVGQRLLDSSAKVITRQALEGLDRQMQARRPAESEDGEATPGEEPAVAAEAPSEAEFARGFAKGLLAEMVPPERRPYVAGGVTLLVLALAAILLRAC